MTEQKGRNKHKQCQHSFWLMKIEMKENYYNQEDSVHYDFYFSHYLLEEKTVQIDSWIHFVMNIACLKISTTLTSFAMFRMSFSAFILSFSHSDIFRYFWFHLGFPEILLHASLIGTSPKTATWTSLGSEMLYCYKTSWNQTLPPGLLVKMSCLSSNTLI